MIAPLFGSITTQGSMWPASWPSSAVAMYVRAFSGSGTLVYQSSHSLPSLAASTSPFSCCLLSGSSRTPWPSSVAGIGWIMERLPLAAVSRRSSEQSVLSEHLAHPAHRLAQAVLVLDQRD